MGLEATAESSLVGQTFDNKFRVLRLIGRGGMGEVFEAEHTELGKRVAVKLMLEKYNGDLEAISRFKREALAASRIGDPHIIDVMDIGTAPDGRAYVVMELLEGQPLSRLIEDHGQLPAQRALRIMRQVLRAVGAAHKKGIVHRDLKPDNIFLQRQGDDEDFVKLLDFGISKIIDPELQAAATKLTTTGVVMGTPLYMAPEQAMGTEVDHRADIYACGVMFYEMLAGRPPFEGNTYAVLVAKLLTTEPPLLSTLREALPPKVISAVHRALEKDPAARFASCDAFLAALPTTNSGSAVELAGTISSNAQPVVGRPAVHPSTLTTARPRSNNTLIIGATLAGIAVATIIIVLMQRSSPVAPPPPNERVRVEAIERARVEAIEPAPTDPTLISLVVTPAEAKVTIDDVVYRTGEQITVLPGLRKVRAELAGFTPQQRDVQVTAHTTAVVQIELAPSPPVDVVAKPDAKKPVATKPGRPSAPRGTTPRDTEGYRPPPPIETPVVRTPPPEAPAVDTKRQKSNPYADPPRT